jgi:hypothetical protein
MAQKAIHRNRRANMTKQPTTDVVEVPTAYSTTQSLTNDPAVRELDSGELNAISGGLYAFIPMTHYWVGCALLGAYLGSNS